ncbi:NAD(P)/FAD-dependent oxidoreductase [Anatilimnocola sp. NA78]|uniref:NAD(P)/FAD-dependent oxidoreductase n=1 Tax=Anatilimnocola sp. NA78 TaxID=3415683 RepID=UPI003CE4BA3A
MNLIRTVGIIGAGVAGLTCGRALQQAGIQVTLLEKSRGVGGRVATRRLESGVTFDHGAQYFTARDPAFQEQVDRWLAAGTVRSWMGKIVSLDRGETTDLHEERTRYVGVPGMNAIAKALAADLKVLTNTTAVSLQRLDHWWQVIDSANQFHGPFDCLISTAPAEQSTKLIADHSQALRDQIANVPMAPCWAVMMQIPEPVPTSFDAAFVQHSPLSWIARNSSKPERATADCWVLHASAAWSIAHLEESADEIAQVLANEFWLAVGQPRRSLSHLLGHRWRYALPAEPLEHRFLLDHSTHLAVCGDWCGGPRVEGAFLSGLALAEEILAKKDRLS